MVASPTWLLENPPRLPTCHIADAANAAFRGGSCQLGRLAGFEGGGGGSGELGRRVIK